MAITTGRANINAIQSQRREGVDVAFVVARDYTLASRYGYTPSPLAGPKAAMPAPISTKYGPAYPVFKRFSSGSVGTARDINVLHRGGVAKLRPQSGYVTPYRGTAPAQPPAGRAPADPAEGPQGATPSTRKTSSMWDIIQRMRGGSPQPQQAAPAPQDWQPAPQMPDPYFDPYYAEAETEDNNMGLYLGIGVAVAAGIGIAVWFASKR